MMAIAYHKNGPQQTAVTVPMGSILEAAMIQAASGSRVFPLVENTTTPLIPNWREVATADQSIVRQCWEAAPESNVGLVVDNRLIFHTSTAKGATTLNNFFRDHLAETPKTHCVVFAMNKREQHHYAIFSLPEGTHARRIENVLPGVTALASDDFIVGPGSVVNGYRCQYTNAHPIADAPKYLKELCGLELPPESNHPMSNVVPLKKAATSAPIKTKLDWALEAAQYIPVHPLRWYVDPGPDASPEEREKAVAEAKAAMVDEWPNLATQDPQQIRKWWTQWPDANIGGATSGLITLDIDNRKGGDDTFKFLQLVNDFPETAATNTQGGGQHLLYAAPGGELFKNGNDKLGQGIDIKAHRGYVLMPGSTIDGRSYTRRNKSPIAFAPQWIVDQLKAATPKGDAAGKRIVEEDDLAVELATKWMLQLAPLAEQGNRDNTAHSVAAGLYDYGVTYQTALELMLEWNELKCSPPLDLEDIERVTGSAVTSRESAIGSKHPLAPGFEAVEIDESKAPLPAEIDEIETTTAAAPIPTAKSGDVRAWENEPNAIFVDHLKPADLPAGVLPEVVEQFARDSARRLGVEAGAPAAALVTALGSLVPAGNRLQMRQRDPKWTVSPILWTVIVAPSGSNKSATINAAMVPVKELQSAWRKSFAAVEHKRKLEETRRAKPEKANKAKPENTDEVFEGELAEAEKPRFRQKIYNDATTEALAVALCENPEGLLYHADELAGWLAGMDAYRAKGGKDRAFWLQAKEGGDFIVNRKLSERICVENCAISVLGGIQPDKIKDLKKGMADDGLLQRFTPIVLHRRDSGADIDPDKALDDRVSTAANAIAEAGNDTLYRFSPEADAELHAIEAFKAREIARPDASPTLCQWLDKMPNEFGRLSLVFHFIEHYGASDAAVGTPPAAIISRDTAERARRYLTEFVYSHALTFYLKDLGASTMDEHALWVAGFVLARGLSAISSRDIYRAYPALKSPEKRNLIAATMRVLEMHDWVKPVHIDRHGVEDRWTVNPAVHDGRFEEIAATERRRRDGVQESIKQGAAA